MRTLLRQTGTAPEWTAAWSTALAELEIGVDEAEALLRAGTDDPLPPARPWLPPSHLGVLPAPLRERAQALVARQLRVAQSLAEAADLSRRHLRVLDQVRPVAETTPVYLDTAG
ncbi:hypothetical protein [Pengzhenrongella sicca]|uniref:Uncharacterized protein n=1 Tax=Pengzhenrongella sicca TaxID=2819238 RepID=A0A8A4ZJT3_9MICO|nr:hypothetical protein [Pengzhenrongella sicca]QTE29858.1 hypothetical protein J4E96_02150 [Pengzhenrongella sicca]